MRSYLESEAFRNPSVLDAGQEELVYALLCGAILRLMGKPAGTTLPIIPAKVPAAVDAAIVVSSAGQEAIVLPFRIFWGLAEANQEFFWLWLLHEYRGLGYWPFEEAFSTLTKAVRPAICQHIWGACEYGCQNADAIVDQDGNRIKCLLLQREGRSQVIWGATFAQQLFMILHEYGHLESGPPSSSGFIGRGAKRLYFKGHDAETMADLWAARQLRKAIDEEWLFWASLADRSYAHLGTFLLFEYLELLRRVGLYALDASSVFPRERWDRISEILTGTIGSDERKHVFDWVEETRHKMDVL